MTLTNLPASVTHNEAEADFTVPESFDISLIGQHRVTIRGEIRVPVDAQKSAYLTLFEQYDFLVTLQPCKIMDFFDKVRVIELRYNIGTADMTDGSYEYEQSP